MTQTHTKSRVAVAMSGGVDSSVTASILQKQGHDVFGVTMRVSSGLGSASADARTEAMIADAKNVAAKLCIEHQVVDLSAQFRERIIEPFCDEYLSGRTPNPCIVCNKKIKFSALWEFAKSSGAEYIATGHYVTVEHGSPCRLKKGVDASKDQSYFLCRLDQDQLAHIITPLGAYKKSEVRTIAQSLELPVAHKAESQEICFLPDGDYARFVIATRREKSLPGPIVDTSGTVVGTHQGLVQYTIGQRRGLGVAFGSPRYVVAILPQTNTLVIGDDSDLMHRGVEASSVHWIVPPLFSTDYPVRARIRYRHTEASGRLIVQDAGTAVFIFDSPQRAITPGQQLVFYHNDEVLGGGFIERAFHPDEDDDTSA